MYVLLVGVVSLNDPSQMIPLQRPLALVRSKSSRAMYRRNAGFSAEECLILKLRSVPHLEARMFDRLDL